MNLSEQITKLNHRGRTVITVWRLQISHRYNSANASRPRTERPYRADYVRKPQSGSAHLLGVWGDDADGLFDGEVRWGGGGGGGGPEEVGHEDDPQESNAGKQKEVAPRRGVLADGGDPAPDHLEPSLRERENTKPQALPQMENNGEIEALRGMASNSGEEEGSLSLVAAAGGPWPPSHRRRWRVQDLLASLFQRQLEN